MLKLNLERPAFTKQDTLIFKGIGILLIVFHNFFHWVSPYTGENEFNFQLSRIYKFSEGIANDPFETINLFFSYFGHYGVQIFFFFSGYGLMRAYGNKTIPYPGFIKSRLKKLYPVYVIAIVFFFVYNLLVFGKTMNLVYFRDILLQLSFLNNFIPGFIFRLNGPWWFYSVIVQLYLLFPLLVAFNKKFQRYGLVMLLIAWTFINAGLFIWLGKTNFNPYFIFSGHLPVFMLGMIWAKSNNIRFSLPVTILALVIFVLGDYYEYFWYFSQLAITVVMINLISFWPKKIGAGEHMRKLVVFYGSISMYLFATHGFLRKPIVDWANGLNNAWSTLAYAIAFMLMATILAFITMKTEQISNFISARLEKLNAMARDTGSSIMRSLRQNLVVLYRITIAFFLTLLLLRIYEIILLKTSHAFPEIRLEDFFTAIGVDFALSLGLSGLFFFIYLVLPFGKAILPKIIHITTAFIFLICGIGLIQYYNSTLDLLDHVVYAYSLSALGDIASSGAELNFINLFPYVLFSILFLVFLRISPKWNFSFSTTLFALVLSLYFLADHKVYYPKQYQFKSTQQHDFVNNKMAYFGKKLVDNRPGKNDNNVVYDDDLLERIEAYQGLNPERDFLSKVYPYLYKEKPGSNLRPFFSDKIDSIKPNIVLILVESLSASLSGEYARNASFTPFIDSLATQGLYWPNALSCSERTFGALPSLLGSLPPANTGFVEMADSMPTHLNLVSIMKQNEYNTLFFYGGWPGFNNMEEYLNTGFIDYIETEFQGSEKMPTYSDGFTWGYGDKELFNYSLKFLEENIDPPYFSTYLTLTNHSPYMILDNDFYEDLTQKRIIELGLEDDPGFKKHIGGLKTHIYTDHAMKEFFAAYEQREDYTNSIFIITGDHISFSYPKLNNLETYHVPLIIYSPLIEKPLKSERLVSHLDLMPSLQKLFAQNDSIDFPSQVHWIGEDLDTAVNFASNRTLAMMSANREISDYLYQDYFLSNGALYRISDDLALEMLDNRTLLDSINQSMISFDQVNKYSCNTDKIYPSSLFTDWFKVLKVSSYRNSFEDTKDPGHNKHFYSSDAYSGKSCLYMDTAVVYSHIVPDINFEYDLNKLNLQLSLFAKHYLTHKLPVIVFDLRGKDGEVVFWKKLELPAAINEQPDKWHSFKARLPISLDQKIEVGMQLRIYFWNNNKQGSILYDDVEITIMGLP